MAIIGSMGGYLIYNSIRKATGNIILSTAIAAWASVVIASGFCAIELAFSETSPLIVALPAMIIIHALIGVGEAIISSLVVGFVLKTRPDLIYNKEK
jgi:cobalt/nickel transport system permease protein